MQNPILKKTYSSLAVFFIFILHVPLIFANSKPYNELNGTESHTTAASKLVMGSEHFLNSADELYDSMQLNLMGLSKQTFAYAIKGFHHLLQTGQLKNDNIISIVDFSMPSTKKRLFVIDLDQAKVVFNTYVAHGVNSGTAMASQFSNEPESYKSSLGFYETTNTYSGGHGYSLRLEGLEKGINDNTNRRAIVIHGAAYVNETLIKTQGYIGRSWGCPALPQNLYKPIIDKIKNGTCLFIYSPDKSYLNMSKIINA